MDKATKRELKTPDRIWLASRDFLSWASDQWAILLAAVGFIFLAVVVLSLYTHFHTKSEGEAQSHFVKAKSYWQQTTLGSEADKAQAKANVSKELQILKNEYAGSKANGFAAMLRAELARDEGKKDEMISELISYKDALPSSQRDIGLYPLAVAYEDAGRWEDAQKAFESVSKVERSPYRAWALLGKARMERELNRIADARKTYELFLEKYGQKPEASAVRGLLAEVKLQESKAPKTTP